MKNLKVLRQLIILGLIAPVTILAVPQPARASDNVSMSAGHMASDKTKDGGGTPRPTPPPGPPK